MACWSLALLALVGGPVTAQPLGNELPGSWMSTWSNGPPSPGFQPSAWLGRRGVGASLGGNLVFDIGGDHVLAPGDGAGFRGPVLELRAQGARTSLQQSGGARAFSGRLHLVRPEYGLWLASSGFQADHTHGVLPLLGAGTWLERGRLTFATQVLQLLSPVRTARPEPTSKAPSDTAGTTRLEPGRGPLGAGEDVRLLTGGEASVTLEAVPGPQAVFGIRLAVGPTPPNRGASPAEAPRGLRLEALEGSRYRLELVLQGRSVEVSSDATEWIPLAAHQVAPGRWEATLVLSPGVHRIAIRVDGGPWQAPPGLPAAPDGFGGEVGLVTVD